MVMGLKAHGYARLADTTDQVLGLAVGKGHKFGQKKTPCSESVSGWLARKGPEAHREIVIGLQVHAKLLTEARLSCACGPTATTARHVIVV
jgi:hypothetical protein